MCRGERRLAAARKEAKERPATTMDVKLDSGLIPRPRDDDDDDDDEEEKYLEMDESGRYGKVRCPPLVVLISFADDTLMVPRTRAHARTL